MSDAQERFRNIRLREEYDMHDRKDPLSVVLLFLRKRSKIIEILAAQEIVLALDNRVFVQHLTEERTFELTEVSRSEFMTSSAFTVA
ncbi:hypothetical protein JHK82_015254 [Glycine max]|nr:hypothetical protein JHK85_015635 [Glycine max]KAG5045872.1 hypothetical protein JHK86_015278 [Glycine max]KAG5148373.1 hypothetical protein JHK82_015254 [Glycine max]